MTLIRKLAVLILIFYLILILTLSLLSSESESESIRPKSLSTYYLIQTHFKEISNVSNMETCQPHYYPFSKEEIKSIFAYQNYSRCPIATDVIFSYKNRVLNVSCKKPKNAMYSTEFRKGQVLGGGVKFNVFWRKSKDFRNSGEFSFIRCSSSSIHALVFNRFNSEYENKANLIRSTLNPRDKKMSVLLLVFDSISKFNYQRFFNKTINFLNDLNKKSGNFSYYEFEKSATPHHFTIDNMAQILFGKKLEELTGKLKTDIKGKTIIPRAQKDNQKHSIWTFYKNLGYVTMFLHDSVWDYISLMTGRLIETDHSFVEFWKYTWGVYNWHDFSNEQRCAGSKNSHDLSFDYTYQYFDNYAENNKFAYVHLNAAHDSSGNVQTIDEDLVRFLDDFLKMIEKKGESLALFMISDHGYKYMNMIQWDFRSFYEIHMPMTHLLITKDIESELNPSKNLEKNKEKLLSRLDLNLSLKQLAYFPYHISPSLKDLKNYEFPTYSLFSEEIPNNRTCSEIGVSKEHCLCSWYSSVNITESREIIIKSVFIDLLSEYFESNSKTFIECSPLSNFSLTSFKSFQLQDLESGLTTLYYFEFDFEDIKIKAIGNFCLKNKEKMEIIVKEDKTVALPYTYFKVPEGLAFLQVSEVEVPEECFSNICECKEDFIKISKNNPIPQLII